MCGPLIGCLEVSTFLDFTMRKSLRFIPLRVAAPCRLLDDDIGPGAAATLRRRAGSVCRLLTSGTIRVGDTVEVCTSSE